MVDILHPNYETVTAICEHCGTTCVFSRVDDLKTVDRVSGERVKCLACTREFWITCDVIISPYQFLIDDARDQVKIKRYMPAIASLTQAWEVFFAEFAWGKYLYAPFFATDRCHRDIKDLNDLSNRLADVTEKFTFFPMRNLLLNTVARGITPRTVPEAATAIERIKAEGLGNDPSPALIAQVSDSKTREVLEQTLQVTVGRLRNDVIHKHAYRPRRTELEPCVTEEIDVLYRLKRRLDVKKFMEHQMGAA